MFYRALRYNSFCKSRELGLVVLYEPDFSGTVQRGLRQSYR